MAGVLKTVGADEDTKMGLSTHLGAWLLGTVKNTTGTIAGEIRNTGATQVAQSFDITSASTTGRAFALPAGAMITRASLLTTTAFTGGTTPTVTLAINGTNITNAVSLGAVGQTVATLGAVSATAAGLVKNVGTTDALVNFTVAGGPTAGAGTLVIEYVVRNSDGTDAPTAFTA